MDVATVVGARVLAHHVAPYGAAAVASPGPSTETAYVLVQSDFLLGLLSDLLLESDLDSDLGFDFSASALAAFL